MTNHFPLFIRIGIVLVSVAIGFVIGFVVVGETIASKDRSWPAGKTILYYDKTDGLGMEIFVAARQWEATGLDIRFEEVYDEDEAELLILSDTAELGNQCPEQDCVGVASDIGKSDRSIIYLFESKELPSVQDRLAYLPVVVHELGHILGLDHGSKCSIMAVFTYVCNQSVVPTRGGSYELFCGPFEEDIKRLENMYDQDLRVPGKCFYPTGAEYRYDLQKIYDERRALAQS